MEFYLYTSKNILNLPKVLELEGTWEVAVTEILGRVTQSCYLCADFVEPSIVDHSQLGVIRKLYRSTTLSKTFDREEFHTINRNRLGQLHLFLIDFEGNRIENKTFEVVLHFRLKCPTC